MEASTAEVVAQLQEQNAVLKEMLEECKKQTKENEQHTYKLEVIYAANIFSFKNLFPQTHFHAKTISRKHFSIQKPCPANIFLFKNHIPQTFFHLKTLSRKHFFIYKPYPANKLSCKNLFPQTVFH